MGVVYGGGYPRDMPKGHVPGVHHPVPHPHPAATAVYSVHGSQERTSGLKRARRVRAQARAKGLWPLALLYLRPFSAGRQNPAKPGSTNGWIASRSRAARAGLDVQDLVGL